VLCLRYHRCCHKNKPTKKKKKEGEFSASIIAATKWLWSAAITPAVAIPAAALVAVNRWMTGWMKCSSGWMDHGMTLGEASFNIPSSFTIY